MTTRKGPVTATDLSNPRSGGREKSRDSFPGKEKLKEGLGQTGSPARLRTGEQQPAFSPSEKSEAIRARWAGYKKVQRTPASKASTKIPRVPPQQSQPSGKENRPVSQPQTPNSGAKIAKPVARPTVISRDVVVSPTEELESPPRPTELAPDSTPSRSPNYISSKLVPNLHSKFLAKIKSNKCRASPVSTPCRPSPWSKSSKDVSGDVSIQIKDHQDSPINDKEVEQYLKMMFSACDKYKTGRVPSDTLLSYLSNLVELPKLDKWKLEELRRLLDPTMDNRYVDLDVWFNVGKTWVEMMMDPENHASSGNSSCVDESEALTVDNHTNENVEIKLKPDNSCEDEADISFGSYEGVGVQPGCSSREVELENKVSELKYQLAKFEEKHTDLRRAYSAMEDISANLTIDLELSKRKLATASSQRERNDSGSNKIDTDLVSQEMISKVEQKCYDLANRVEILVKDNDGKSDTLKEYELELKSCRRELEDATNREEQALFELKNYKESNEALKNELTMKSDELLKEKKARERLEAELNDKTEQMTGMEEEFAVREEGYKSQILRESHIREGSVASTGSSNVSNSVHDLSVDDRIIEEFHSHRPENVTPLRRGPSASSTPHKGSICEELKECEKCEVGEFLSPLCEKERSGRCPKSEVLRSQERLSECLRKLLIDQVDQTKNGKLMATLNKALLNHKKEVESYLEELVTQKDFQEVKEKFTTMQKAVVENLANKETEDAGEERLEEVEDRLQEMVSLLQTANEKLLASSTSITPECSMEPDVDLSNWQLDLEGIQLTRRLLHYRKDGDCKAEEPAVATTANRDASTLRQNLSKEVSRLVSGQHSKLWMSLFKKLEDLHTQTEVSRDLLQLAGDSIRTDASYQPSPGLDTTTNLFPKTVSCQTDRALFSLHSAATQTEPEHGEASQLQLSKQEFCPLADCSCPHARPKSRRLRNLLRFSSLAFFLLVVFTFCCGLEVDRNHYLPVTWFYFRKIFGEQLPRPLTLVSYNSAVPFRETF